MALAMFDIFKTRHVPKDIVFRSVSAEGSVESIHIGGRTEVAAVIGVKLTQYDRHLKTTKWGRETCLWRLEADIVQPEGRSGYFAPHLNGIIDVKQKAGQLAQHGDCSWDTLADMIVGWGDFRSANIAFKDDKPVSVHFTHLKFSGKEWIMVASFVAHF